MSLKSTHADLEQECIQIAERMTKFKEEIPEKCGNEPARCPEDVRRHNLNFLRHAVEVAKSKPLSKPISNPLLCATNLEEELGRMIAESRQIYESVESEWKELSEKSDKKHVHIIEQNCLHSNIQDRIKMMTENEEMEKSPAEFARLYARELAMAQRATLIRRKFFTEKMIEFLDKEFPKINDHNADVRYKRLGQIIEELFSSALDHAENPYMRVLPDFWPPYLELLLKYNICLRHPEDKNKIRLAYMGL